jgi:hypothetical protein
MVVHSDQGDTGSSNLLPAVRTYEPLTVEDVIAHVRLIDQVVDAVMKRDVHYGIIPGTEKPTLYLPGAQKIALTFRLVPRFEETVAELPNGHAEFSYVCSLYGPDGRYLGAGIGSCTTMEKKYRYRDMPPELTENQVPKKYWDIRKGDPKGALELIGGPGFCVAKDKDTGAWMIAKRGERGENHDIADCRNTAKKIGKKRSYVDAVLTVTGCGDRFTQDLEDMAPAKPDDESALHENGAAKEPTTVRGERHRKRVETITGLSTLAAADAYAQKIEDAHKAKRITDDEYQDLKNKLNDRADDLEEQAA